jgi:glyoxylate reductase
MERVSTIITTLNLPDELNALLREAGTLYGPDDWEHQLSEADAVLSLLSIRIDQAFLDRAPKVRVVANAAVGYDNVDVAACAARGVTVTNTPGVLTDATADIALALILSAMRGLPKAERRLRKGDFQGWKFWDNLESDVTGATLGIFGMGKIGKAVAHRAAAFGMPVQYNSRTRLPLEEEEQLSLRWVDFETLLRTSDVISLHAPYTSATHHVIDAAALGRMKQGSYLINTARGPLVDEAALVEALKNGPLAGAGLDVYEREPIVHPGLLEAENVSLLPHVGSATRGTRLAMATLAARNIHSFLTTGTPITPIPMR